MYTCFIITPIGESGSETRRNSDDLRDLLIKPVLEPLGFEVIRGDHRSEAGQIDIDVIRAVQESDLCIADISLPNPNVFYEFGRRDETGKPLILLKSRGSEDLPVDVATRRYIEYDLDSRRGIIDAMEQLRSFVAPIVEKGFESTGNGSSLSELAEILKRVERKIDRLETTRERPVDIGSDNSDSNANPVDVFLLALQQRNIPLAEQAMTQLKYRMDDLRWLDQVVEQVAALGSRKAGDIMIDRAAEFIDSAMSISDKMDFLGCLVSNLTRTDRELDNLSLVEQICDTLTILSVDEPLELRIQPPNQLNRLYYGIYSTTKETIWLDKAIDALEKALRIDNSASFLHYNIGLCLEKKGDLQSALQHLLHCVALDGDKHDADHLEELCELLYKLNDPRLTDYLAELEIVNIVKARLLRTRFNK